MSAVITVLAFLHIISATGWLGGAVLFVSAIAPGLRSMSPSGSLEFLAKVGPRTIRFFVGTATATIVFGLALLASDTALLATSIAYGAALGLAAYVFAGVTMISFRKADHLAKKMLDEKQSGSPPPEFAKALKTGGIAVAVTTLLLVLSLLFMVAAGFPF